MAVAALDRHACFLIRKAFDLSLGISLAAPTEMITLFIFRQPGPGAALFGTERLKEIANCLSQTDARLINSEYCLSNWDNVLLKYLTNGVNVIISST